MIVKTFDCHRSTVWLGSSVVRVLARSARGPWFESRSGHVLFPPLCYLVASVGECSHGLREVQMSQRRKSTRPDRGSNPGPLANRASTLATELPHGRPVTISPCLIRFVPESARNHSGTDETVPLLLAAQARTHTEAPNDTGEEKAHGPTGTRTQDLS